MLSRALGFAHDWCCFVLLVVAAAGAGRAAAAAPSRRSPLVHFSLSELQESSFDVRARLRHALQVQGAVMVGEVPGYESTVAEALHELGDCLRLLDGKADAGFGDEGPVRSVFSSSVERLTLATSTEGGSPRPLPPWAIEQCPGLRAPAARLRAVIDWLVTLFARCVDDATGEVISAMSRPRGKQQFAPQRLQDAVRLGKRVEHFHRYARPLSMEMDQTSLSNDEMHPVEMHTDMGLFQALAVTWRTAGDRGLSLEVELPDGSTVSVEPPSGVDDPSGDESVGNALLFFTGQGLSEWMPHLEFRAAPHALSFRNTLDGDRLVYGVMVLPPADWQLDGHSGENTTTFGEWWDRAQLALAESPHLRARDSNGLGCLSTMTLHRRLADLSNSCAAGSIYCWMQCVKTDNLPCDSNAAICKSGQTGEVCTVGEKHIHDASCAPKCPPTPLSENTSYLPAGDFCNGILTDMHMTGFVWNAKVNPCLVLLFPGWNLTDTARFWVAVAGTVLAAMLAEYLIAVRRRLDAVKQWIPASGKNGMSIHHRLVPFTDRAWRLTLYAGSRALGYFVMLITMTYSAELFIAVLLGLTCGHALFNLSAPAGADMTACCQAGCAGGAATQLGITTLGKDSKAGRARFVVTGMTCGACISTVRHAVEQLSTVQAITESSLESGMLEVEFKKSATAAKGLAAGVDEVCRAVQSVGFGVTHMQFDVEQVPQAAVPNAAGNGFDDRQVSGVSP